MKTRAISVLGTQKDAHGGKSPARWNTWRPTIGLVQQEALRIDELHLILNEEFLPLAEQVRADIGTVSPETKVLFDIVELKDPWDFEEVYEKFSNDTDRLSKYLAKFGIRFRELVKAAPEDSRRL